MSFVLRGLALVAIMSLMGMTAAYLFDLVSKPRAPVLELNELMKFVGCIFWAAPMALITLILTTGLEWATVRTGVRGPYTTGNAVFAGAVFGLALPVGMMMFNWSLRQMAGPGVAPRGSSFFTVGPPDAIGWWLLLLFCLPPVLAAVTLTAFRALWPDCSNATLP
ncbi:MAG: hypothetical protein ACKVP7_06045 [Hyphomicrobiaceae bacterium]